MSIMRSIACIELQAGAIGTDEGSLATRASLPAAHNTLTLPPLKKNARGAWEGRRTG